MRLHYCSCYVCCFASVSKGNLFVHAKNRSESRSIINRYYKNNKESIYRMTNAFCIIFYCRWVCHTELQPVLHASITLVHVCSPFHSEHSLTTDRLLGAPPCTHTAGFIAWLNTSAHTSCSILCFCVERFFEVFWKKKKSNILLLFWNIKQKSL